MAGAAHKSALAQTIDARSLPCPHCQLTADRTEQTEWITIYVCGECGWRFARKRVSGH